LIRKLYSGFIPCNYVATNSCPQPTSRQEPRNTLQAKHTPPVNPPAARSDAHRASDNEKTIMLFKAVWRLKTPRMSMELSNEEILAYARRGETVTRAVEVAREDQAQNNTPGIDY
jgi:hypothetical protein